MSPCLNCRGDLHPCSHTLSWNMTASFTPSLCCKCSSSRLSGSGTVLVCKQSQRFHMFSRASFHQRSAHRPTWSSSTRFGVGSHTGKPRCEAALAENPQNVPDPKVLRCPTLTSALVQLPNMRSPNLLSSEQQDKPVPRWSCYRSYQRRACQQ